MLLLLIALACGCRHGHPDVPPRPAEEDLITYPIPAEGVSVNRLVEDAERVLGRKISCSETALAQTKPIRIIGLPRVPRSEALLLFQSLFLTLRLGLYEPPGQDLGLLLEALDSSGLSIRGGGFYWIDDIASQTAESPIKTVVLLRHVRAQDIDDAITPFRGHRAARFEELIAPNGWLVEAPRTTILRMLEVVRALDIPPVDSMPTSRTPR